MANCRSLLLISYQNLWATICPVSAKISHCVVFIRELESIFKYLRQFNEVRAWRRGCLSPPQIKQDDAHALKQYYLLKK